MGDGERYLSPENTEKWEQWKTELAAAGKSPTSVAEELERLEWIPRGYITWLRRVIQIMDEKEAG